MSQSPSPSGSSRDHHSADDVSSLPVRGSAGADTAGHQPPHIPRHPARAKQGRSSLDALLESRVAVLCILFFVTGALGLPLLWFARGFSWPARFFWAVVVTIYTVVLIALVAMVLRWSYNQIYQIY